MIDAPSACFFTIKVMDEAAQQLATEISPAASADITEVLLVSNDFEYDINALVDLDTAVNHVRQAISASNQQLSISEEFNPLYLPAGLEKLDELLELQIRSDNFRFTGFNGNPFTIKLINVNSVDHPVLTAQAQYHPFNLPSYSDILQRNEAHRCN